MATKKPKPRNKLPSPRKVLQARDWLFAGAPAVSQANDAKQAVKILIALIRALPAVLPVYNCTTREWRKAMGIREKDYLATMMEGLKR